MSLNARAIAVAGIGYSALHIALLGMWPVEVAPSVSLPATTTRIALEERVTAAAPETRISNVLITCAQPAVDQTRIGLVPLEARSQDVQPESRIAAVTAIAETSINVAASISGIPRESRAGVLLGEPRSWAVSGDSSRRV